MARPLRSLALVLLLVLAAPSLVSAAGVEVRFDVSSPTGAPYPSDVFTVPDATHLTGLRVNLPLPDCSQRPTDCADIQYVLNTLDGFNQQPRLTVPFTGAIDPASVSSANVFLVSLGGTTGGGGGKVVGINQLTWEPAANALHVESDELLDQHARYALVITRSVKDAAGDPLETGGFAKFRKTLNYGQTKDPVLKAYRKALLDALAVVSVPESEIAGMSVFTTQSVTAVLEKIRNQIKAVTPAPAVMHGVFPIGSFTSIQWSRQTGTAPSYTLSSLPTFLLNPTYVAALAFGQFQSNDYEDASKIIPAVGTATGVPAVQSASTLQFTLFLPAGTPPASGWPVVVFGHGFGDSKHGAPFVVASTLAANGLASIAINVVGHGGGALGTLTVNRVSGGPLVVPDGGRGIDQNTDGVIASTEGSSAAAPYGLVSSRDGLRQTVADIMQLVRVIETGGIAGLDGGRVYYAGQSFGGIYGTILLAVEPSLRAGVPNVPGGAIIEIARLSPSFRPLVQASLAARVPSLLNGGVNGFTENMPLRDEPVRIDTVAGASAIQEVIENTEWASMSGNPVAYAPYIRRNPLAGMDGTPVIVQFAKGDRTVPNPTSTAIIRAGDLADRATYYLNTGFVSGSNPHAFLTNLSGAAAVPALQAQTQMAIFFASDGTVVVDPDGTGTQFQTPISDPLPETLNF